MTPLKLLALVHAELEKYPSCYAVAGGLAASFYRSKPRITNDVDIAFSLGNIEKTKQEAKKILQTVGLKPSMEWIDSSKKISDPIALVIGRPNKEEIESTVDFLLPTFPWIESAIGRAQDNIIDFGFAKFPSVTPEDLIVAKAYALSIEKNRFSDMDDIQSIFQAGHRLDIPYMVTQLEFMDLSFPIELSDALPPALRRKIRR